MLIDSPAIKLSGQSTMSTCPPDSTSIINKLFAILPTVGWSSSGHYFPSATIHFQFGFPTTTSTTPGPGLTPVTCSLVPTVTFDRTHYQFYDPHTETPVVGDATCVMVPMGLTSAASGANLALAMTTGVWGASVAGNDLTVSGLVPGPALNGAQIAGTPALVTGPGITAGGGYKFTSKQNLDPGANIRTSTYSVVVTAQKVTGGGGDSLLVQFVFDLNAGTITYILDTYGSYTSPTGVVSMRSSAAAAPNPSTYTLVANPYSFAMWDESEDAGVSESHHVSLFACAPYIPTEEEFVATPTTNAVFLVGAGSAGAQAVRNSTHYNQSTTAVALDAPATFNDFNQGSGCFPRLLALRSPGTTPLDTPSGVPVITNSWVMMARNNASTPQVVGKVWDCAMVNDYVDGMMIDGHRYLRVSRQDGSNSGTRCSLVFCVDQTPQSPTERQPNVQGDLSVTFAGPELHRTSGAAFVPGDVGRKFYLNAVPNPPLFNPQQYTITSWIDADHVLLSPALPDSMTNFGAITFIQYNNIYWV